MEYIIGGFYFTGAYLHWHLCNVVEELVSQQVKEEVEVVPWQKTLFTAIWPMSSLYLLMINLFPDKSIDDDE